MTTTPQSKVYKEKRINRKLQNYHAGQNPACFFGGILFLSIILPRKITCSCGANSLADLVCLCSCASPVSSQPHMPISVSALFFYLSWNNLYAIPYQERYLTWSLVPPSKLNMSGIVHYCSSLRYYLCTLSLYYYFQYENWHIIVYDCILLFAFFRYLCCKYGDLVWFAWLPECHVRSLSSYADMPSYLAFGGVMQT